MSEELKKFFLRNLPYDEKLLETIPKELQDDNEIFFAAAAKHEHALKYCSEKLTKDQKFMKLVLKLSSQHFKNASIDLKKDKNFIYNHVERDGFEFIDEELKDDETFMKKMIQKDTMMFFYCSKNLKSSKEFVLFSMSCRIPFDIFKDISEELRNDREIVKSAFKYTSSKLFHLSFKFKSDREIVKLAVENDGNNILDASKELRDDEELGLISVRKYGLSLSGLSIRLRGMKYIAVEAIKNNPDAISSVSLKLREDLDFMLEVFPFCSKDLNFFQLYIPEKLTKIKEFYLQTKNFFELFPEELRSNEEFAIEMINLDIISWDYFSPSMTYKTKFQLKLIESGAVECFQYFSNPSRRNDEIIQKMIKSSASIIRNVKI